MKNEFKVVSVIGLGYIGLPTAALIASKNLEVLGVDVNQKVVNTINEGKIHIVEPLLNEIVKTCVSNKKLSAAIKPKSSDVFIIAVPTPFADNNQPDLRFVQSAFESIAPVIKSGDLIILESTSPVGTTEEMVDLISKIRPDLTFPNGLNSEPQVNVAYCPERVLPGKIIQELVSNDRVIGGITTSCSERAVNFYKIFVEGECVKTNVRTAEMCKLTENSFRDVNIAFANELSIICDKLKISVWELIKLANRHPRVDILQPGAGVGGHCIAVDPWFIVSKNPEEALLIKTARDVNDSKPYWVIDQANKSIQSYLVANPSKTPSEISIACFGLAFKPDIDDLRESPSLEIAKHLSSLHLGELLLVEPSVDAIPEIESKTTRLVSIKEAIDKADIVLILVKHQAFESIPISSWADKIIIDACGFFQAH